MKPHPAFDPTTLPVEVWDADPAHTEIVNTANADPDAYEGDVEEVS